MTETLIIGAGPAGLTAAYELSRLGLEARVVECDGLVGGISRTVEYEGYRFDIGGHRFFTKVSLVSEIWHELLGDDFLERPRLSRIYYDGKFFDYPLKPLNALRGLGPWEAVRVGASYVRSRLLPHREERTFEQWVSNRFGKRLFEIFFKTYTEKVWGMPCSEISSDWAAQRIKNLDLIKAVRNALIGQSSAQPTITTLIDRFHYPRFGPGMMWERCRDVVQQRGVAVELGRRVCALRHDGKSIREVEIRNGDGSTESLEASHVISSMALRDLLLALDPSPPAEVVAAAESLRYRDFLTVVLIVDRAELFPDNWIYIHSPEVRVGRVQNFKSWSPEMVPDERTTSIGLEYFVSIGDDLWTAADDDLIELAKDEMETLGLISSSEVIDGTVVRMPKAYPVYDHDYQQTVAAIRRYLGDFENLQVIGRNGQHRYNNQDHSMLAGIYAARNVAGREHDVWSINVEQEYHEGGAGQTREVGDRLVPRALDRPELEALLREAFAHYDPIALGIAVGSVCSLGLLLATALLLVRGGDPLGPMLSLLGNYFMGFEVSWPGAIVGAIEALIGGFALGYSSARLINISIESYEASVRRKIELERTLDPLESSQT